MASQTNLFPLIYCKALGKTIVIDNFFETSQEIPDKERGWIILDYQTYQQVVEESTHGFWTCPIIDDEFDPEGRFRIISHASFLKIPESERVYYLKSSLYMFDICMIRSGILRGIGKDTTYSLDPDGVFGLIFELVNDSMSYELK